MRGNYERARSWARARGIQRHVSRAMEFTKLVEELNEIEEDVKDGVGDSLIVLTILADMHGHNLEDYSPYESWRDLKSATGDLARAICRGYDPIREIRAIYCHLHKIPARNGLTMQECFEHALNEIEHRTGTYVGQQWVKDTDLNL